MMRESSPHEARQHPDWVEVIAASEREAREEALAQLGLESEEEVEVVSVEAVEPSGWLERLTGRSQVRVQARRRQVLGERVLQHLQTLLDHVGVEAEPQVVRETEEEIQVDLRGDEEELGLIIGSRGHTLNAIQLLVNAMVNHGSARRKRIVVDADGYREKHRQRLERLAHRSAQKAKRWGREVVLEALTAGERRVIHTALQHDPDVITFSEGEDPHRRLIIAPRRQRSH